MSAASCGMRSVEGRPASPSARRAHVIRRGGVRGEGGKPPGRSASQPPRAVRSYSHCLYMLVRPWVSITSGRSGSTALSTSSAMLPHVTLANSHPAASSAAAASAAAASAAAALSASALSALAPTGGAISPRAATTASASAAAAASERVSGAAASRLSSSSTM